MPYLIALISALLGSSKDLVSKKISFTLSGTLSTFASFAFALPYYVVLLAVLYLSGYESFKIPASFYMLVFLRALTDAFAEWMKMHALSYGDISLVAPFYALAPLFLLFTSPLITGDPLSTKGIFGVLAVVVGGLIIGGSGLHFDRKKANVKGILLALGAAFFLSLNSCFDRLAVQKASPAVSGFAMTVLAALFLVLPMLRQRKIFESLKAHQKPLFLRGFFEVAFMTSKLLALQFLSAPYVLGIQKSSILLSIAGGKFIFKEKQFIYRILGGVLVLVGALVIVAA